jgi:hypothetical protein
MMRFRRTQALLRPRLPAHAPSSLRSHLEALPFDSIVFAEFSSFIIGAMDGRVLLSTRRQLVSQRIHVCRVTAWMTAWFRAAPLAL